MSAHTPEPLHVPTPWRAAQGIVVGIADCYPDNPSPLEKEIAANHAARIVACVNSCAGMDDPAAEIERLRGCEDAAHRLKDGADYLRAQRDALAEALRGALENIGAIYENEHDEAGSHGCCGERSYKPHAAHCWTHKARAALAKVQP